MTLRLVTPDFTPEAALIFNTPPQKQKTEFKHLKRQVTYCWIQGVDVNTGYFEFLEVFYKGDRDACLMSQSNYQCALEAIGGLSETVIESGRMILIHESDKKALKEAEAIMEALTDYPLVDDSHYYEMKREEDQEALDADMRYHLKDLCEALGLDADDLKKKQQWTLEALISESYFYMESYCGEAWFNVDNTRKHFKDLDLENLNPKLVCKKTMKLITEFFGEKKSLKAF